MEGTKNSENANYGFKFFIPSSAAIRDRQYIIQCLLRVAPTKSIIGATLEGFVFFAYTNNIEVFQHILRNGMVYRGLEINAFPSINIFRVCNLLPIVTNEALISVFQPYGEVEEIIDLPFCPDSPELSHIKSSERLVFLHIPTERATATLPDQLSVKYKNRIIRFSVKQYCIFCKDDGHAIYNCSSVYELHAKQTSSPATQRERSYIQNTILESPHNEDQVTSPLRGLSGNVSNTLSSMSILKEIRCPCPKSKKPKLFNPTSPSANCAADPEKAYSIVVIDDKPDSPIMIPLDTYCLMQYSNPAGISSTIVPKIEEPFDNPDGVDDAANMASSSTESLPSDSSASRKRGRTVKLNSLDKKKEDPQS